MQRHVAVKTQAINADELVRVVDRLEGKLARRRSRVRNRAFSPAAA